MRNPLAQFPSTWKTCLFLLCITLLPFSSWAGQVMAGKVIGITDGDTLVLLDDNHNQYKIRISGIDTPEKGQPYGHVATENLATLAFNKLAVADCPKQDRYGRLVCVVKIEGTDIGLSQIQAGLAWHYKKYANEQTPDDRENYSSAENEAKSLKKGIWKEANPVPPWEWRHPTR